MSISREGVLHRYLMDGVYIEHPFDLSYGGWIAHNKQTWWMRSSEGHATLIYNTILPKSDWGHKELFDLGWVALALNVNDFEDRLEVVIVGAFEKVGDDARDTLNQILGLYEALYGENIVYLLNGELYVTPDRVMQDLPVANEVRPETEIDAILEAELERDREAEVEAREREQYAKLKAKYS